MMPITTCPAARLAWTALRAVIAIAATLLACTTALGQANRYSISRDGQEVTDTLTQLVWRRCAEGMIYVAGDCAGTAGGFSHEAALNRAKAEAVTNGKPWRMPNVKELSSILDRSRADSAIDAVAFPSTPGLDFWSSSPSAYDANRVWNVDFHYGLLGYGPRSNAFHLRLVRASQ